MSKVSEEIVSKNLEILKTLEEDASKIFEKHIESRKDWYPHEMIPWSRYSNIEEKGFDYNLNNISQGIISTIYLLLMTEDNLPWFSRELHNLMGGRAQDDTIWSQWLQQWVAEEDNHSYVIRNYVTLNGIFDPYYLERARMEQVKSGASPLAESVTSMLVYPCLQELSGRFMYRNVAESLEYDSEGYHIMSKVASDENRHYIFYRDVVKKALEYYPSEFIIGLAKEGIDFKLPGSHSKCGMIDFDFHTKHMADGGFFNLEIYINNVLIPTAIGNWKIDTLENLTEEAEKARDDIFLYIEKSKSLIERIKNRALKSGVFTKSSDFNKITHIPSLFENK